MICSVLVPTPWRVSTTDFFQDSRGTEIVVYTICSTFTTAIDCNNGCHQVTEYNKYPPLFHHMPHQQRHPHAVPLVSVHRWTDPLAKYALLITFPILPARCCTITAVRMSGNARWCVPGKVSQREKSDNSAMLCNVTLGSVTSRIRIKQKGHHEDGGLSKIHSFISVRLFVFLFAAVSRGEVDVVTL